MEGGVLQVLSEETMAVNTDESSGRHAAGASAERKTCPVCGASFGCMAAQQKPAGART